MIEIEEVSNKCCICGAKLKDRFNPYPIRTLGDCCKECSDKVNDVADSMKISKSLPVQKELK